MAPVQVWCPAKVNLFLEVTGRRKDGYHTLATLFAKISLFDVIDAELAPDGKLDLKIVNEAGQPLSSGHDNLVFKAAEAFRRAFRVGLGAKLVLTKRIPLGAGLGGGSSDAAGALIALSRLHGIAPSRNLTARLKKIALGLGADVPFFLDAATFCEGRGIGEKLKAFSVPASLPWMVLIFPGVPVATKSVYENLDSQPRPAVLTRLSHLDTLKKKLEKGRPISEWDGFLFNRLEEGVLVAYPEVRQAKSILSRLGLKGVLMSGSGSSVFGFVSSHGEGERVIKRLRGYPWRVFLTCCLG